MPLGATVANDLLGFRTGMNNGQGRDRGHGLSCRRRAGCEAAVCSPMIGLVRRASAYAGPACAAEWSAPGWQVLHLLLGDAELDAVVDSGHRLHRDGDFLTPPKVPLLKQHIGHLVVVPVDKEALYPADLTIGGPDSVAVTHLCCTRRDNLLDNGSRWL